jgi:asparagine synthetase B (glutamine-hydrolysing)
VAQPERDEQSAVEREIERRYEDPEVAGKRLSRRARQTRRSVEAYLKAGVLPRYMERLREIERETADHLARLDRAHRALRQEHEGDPATFARRWRARAQSWRFDRVNELIREHNEWYPIESQLPMDPRTRDYQRIRGRSYRREPLGPDWVLERFPADT